MENLKQNIKDSFEEILGNYLNINNMMKTESHETNMDEIKNENFKIDEFIETVEKNVDNVNFLDLALNLGKASLEHGAIGYAKKMYRLVIIKSNNSLALIDFLSNAFMGLGEALLAEESLQESFENITKANELFKKQKDFPGSAKCENLLGIIKEKMNDFESAKDYYKNCVNSLGKERDKYLSGVASANLGRVCYYQNNLDSAISYFYRALAIFQQLNDFRRISEMRYNLGILFTLKNEYDSALTELEMSVNAASRTEYLSNVGKSLYSIANTYAEISDFPLAIAYADRALDATYKVNDKLTIADIYELKGQVNKKLENKELAENYLQTSLRINLDNRNSNYQVAKV